MSGRRQNIYELKLKRALEANRRLQEDLRRPQIRVSEASRRCAIFVDQGLKGWRSLTDFVLGPV
jgi:hypothetical protein